MPRCGVQAQICWGLQSRSSWEVSRCQDAQTSSGDYPAWWVPGHLTLPRVKWPGREAGYSRQILKFRISGAIPPLPLCAFVMGIEKIFALFFYLLQYVSTYCVYFPVIIWYLCCCVSDDSKACHFKDTVEFWVALKIAFLGSCTIWLPWKYEMTFSLLSEVFTEWTAVLWR